MPQSGPYKKVTPGEILFFVFLFVLCIAGSAGIFWFAVGIENGNRIMQGFLRSLLDNAAGIVTVLLLFNIFLVLYYSKKR
jgi:hypothetical protein